MELPELVGRYAEAFEVVDASTTTHRANRRTQQTYLPGIPALGERLALSEADTAWDALHRGELRGRPEDRLDVPYAKLQGARCDHAFTTDTRDSIEWGVEMKFISFVGNNGKNNDFAVAKMLSPYLKDRGILHDAVRLREYASTDRIAVVFYSFTYSQATCDLMEARHGQSATIDNVRDVVDRNGAPLTARPAVVMLDAILSLRGLLVGPRAEARFDAWRNPAGGEGLVVGWEIRRPQREAEYDPRNPW